MDMSYKIAKTNKSNSFNKCNVIILYITTININM